MKQKTRDDFHNLPWKNGGGTTLELIKIPRPCGDDFLFRLSVATIDSSGPFSRFPGIDRHLILLKGHGVRLNFKDRTVLLTEVGDDTRFAGEEEVFGELINGPSVDFNVMFDRSWGKVSATVLETLRGEALELEEIPWAYLYHPETTTLTELRNTPFRIVPNESSLFILVKIETSNRDNDD